MKIKTSKGEDDYTVQARLNVSLPGLDRKTAEALERASNSPVLESF